MKADSGGAERRGSPRIPKTYPIEIHFEKARLIGPSGNVSHEGVYCLSEGSIPVSVSIEIKGKKQTLKGKIVRVGSVNEKTLGVAVQFDNPIADF